MTTRKLTTGKRNSLTARSAGAKFSAGQPEGTDRRADFLSTAPFAPPSASPSASIARRALAALVDGVVLATALAAFATIFLRLNPSLNPGLSLSLSPVSGPLPILAGPTFAATLGLVALLLWKAYEFLFVVYTGSTPGLRAARLRLAEFDGSPLNRRSRRWRVLASLLSAFSAGLGYLWWCRPGRIALDAAASLAPTSNPQRQQSRTD